jgi:hypothetical protein
VLKLIYAYKVNKEMCNLIYANLFLTKFMVIAIKLNILLSFEGYVDFFLFRM